LASTYKILGQSAPADTSNATLYTTPALTQTIVSSITATNVTLSAANSRIFVVPSGGSASASNAVVYDGSLAANTVQAFTLGITLGAADFIQVRTETADAITFQAFGQEIS
jgi:hypothetical protein